MLLVVMVEEPSAANVLHSLLPKLIPPGSAYQILVHRGKSELRKSIPRKLHEWRVPDSRFLILHDQDAADCRALKQDLIALCAASGRPDAVVRIVCRELESWYFGDLDALESAFGERSVRSIRGKAAYRIPDKIVSPARELARLIPGFHKGAGSVAVAKHLDLDRNSSESFSHFVSGVRRLCEET